MKLFKLTLCTIFLVFLIWFFLPYTVAGILNIGNITGITISALGVIYFAFLEQINKKISELSRGRAGKIFLIFTASVFVFVLIIALIVTCLMVKAAVNNNENSDTAIVLGCKVYGERPSLMLVARLEAAEQFLKENSDAKCILSGGKGADEDISEAECMRRYLVERGIAEERLYIEDKSASTEENLLFSKEIIKKQGLGREFVIITNEFHQYRASIVAEKTGLNVTAKNGKSPLWLFPTYYVREMYGILYELIK